jgi:alanyl-tRNA synthetase
VPTDKLYHQDAELRRFRGTVLRCEPAEGGWEVVLDRTAFYPTSGGQPHDTGLLGERPVLAVREEDDGTVVHLTDGQLTGTVTGEVDEARRRDHMEQHSGQHLLSQAFIEVLGAETVSFHLGQFSCSIDIAAETLTPEQVEAVENLANRIVREDRLVITHLADPAEVDRFPLRKPPAVTGTVRIVEMEGFDWSACGGTHVRSTGRLGLIKVKGWERYKRWMRVEWLAGSRALADYQHVDLLTRTLCRSLTLGLIDLPVYVAKLQDESSSLRRQVKALSDKILEAEARELLAEARLVKGVRILRRVVTGRTVDEVKALAQKVAGHPQAVVLFGVKGALPQLIFARSVDLRLDMGAVLKEALPLIDGRGGGSPGAAQGGGTRQDGLEFALDLAAAKVADSLHP